MTLCLCVFVTRVDELCMAFVPDSVWVGAAFCGILEAVSINF